MTKEPHDTSKLSVRVRLTPVDAASHLPDIDLQPGEAKTIGRGTQADVRIDDPSLSRLHARVMRDVRDGSLRVEDLGSTNGVVINGVQQKAATLKANDLVTFGFAEYAVMVRGQAEKQAPRPAPALPSTDFAQETILRLNVKDTVPVDKLALEALLATSRELMAFGDLPALLERTLDRLQGILKPDRCAILFIDPVTGTFVPRAVRPKGAYKSVSEFASSTVIREALSNPDTLIIYDPTLDPKLSQAQSLVGARVHSAICVPLMGRSGAIGALYADRVGGAQVFAQELAQYAAAFASIAATALETAQLYDDREAHFRATLEAFAKAIDARDRYTAGHSERVTKYTLILAHAFGLPEAELEIVRRGGMLHDIGKVGVPDAVLRKPGPLDEEERATIELHPVIGYTMLEHVPFLKQSLPAVRGHHERWDGKGYPDKLAGNDIHLHARLMAVADTYDAMTSARPYRPGLPREEAARRLRAERGTQFEPAALDLYDSCEAEFHAILDESSGATVPAA
jgi:putative nucleotidyltransferase with HDIG domain